MNNTDKMKVEIWSDVMCPFCYIGKRRFEHALEAFPHKEDIDVVWKSFQLNPDMITNPEVSVTDSLAKSKGWSKEHTQKMTDYVVNMAKGEGLNYNYDNIVVANSFNAHRLLQFAKTNGKGDVLKELLLKAYFVEGKNTDDLLVLTELGVTVGLSETEVKNVLNDASAFASEVDSDVAEAKQLGISGVPFFVVDRKYGISGAQESASFLQTLEKAHSAWKAKHQKVTVETIAGPACSPDGTCD